VVYDVALSYSAAIVLAYLTGTFVAYVLAKRYVFTHATRTTRESLPRFVAVNLLGVVQTWAVSLTLAHAVLPALGVSRFVPELAHVVGVAVPAFTSFVGHRLWSFRDGPEAAP
jgi:putative flippase GtrA